MAARAGDSTEGRSAVTPSNLKDVFVQACMSRAVLESVAGKWPALVLMALLEDRHRFNALRRRVDGVSEKMLSQTVQALERDGLVTREVISSIPARVEYSLTPLGGRVAAKVRELADLLEETAEDVRAARTAYVRRSESSAVSSSSRQHAEFENSSQ